MFCLTFAALNIMINSNKFNGNNMILPHSEKAEHIIWELEYEMKNPRNDGWTGRDMKRRLWDIKMKVRTQYEVRHHWIRVCWFSSSKWF